MKIFVKVKANAKENRVEKTGLNDFSVWVKAKPQKGEANRLVGKVLAEYFGVLQSSVCLSKGQASKQKVFNIDSESR